MSRCEKISFFSLLLLLISLHIFSDVYSTLASIIKEKEEDDLGNFGCFKLALIILLMYKISFFVGF